MSSKTFATLTFASLLFVGCGRDTLSALPGVASDAGGAVVDGRIPDAGFNDGAVPDSGDDGGRDGGFTDGFVPDSGTFDGGRPDGGFFDGGPDDAGRFDGGRRDGGFFDGGPGCVDADCAFLDTDCRVGRCDPNGVCRPFPRRNGTPCDDGDACSTNDQCRRGRCRAGPPLVCPPPPDSCSASLCDSNQGCVVRPAPDGTPCDDLQMCTFPDQCMAGLCVGASNPPMGDACPGLPLAEQIGVQTETGNNVCGTDLATGTCGGNGGRDNFYRLTIADPRRIVAETVAPAGGGYDTALYVRGTCARANTELVCDNNGGTGNFSLIDRQFDPGTYFFVVDGRNATAQGDYQLEVEVDPQNTCANPTNIPIPMMGTTIRFNGSTNGATNDFEAPCAGNQQSPDHVYRVVVTQVTRIRFETESIPNMYDTALALHASPCTAGMPMTIACDDDGGPNTLSLIEVQLNPGTYFLTVDGFLVQSQGRYRLAVTNLPTFADLTFPEAADARLTQVGTTFSQDGDFVEGIRNGLISTVTRMDIDLRITNNLTCGFHRTQVMINGMVVGNLFITPGETRIMRTFMFPPAIGPNYALRLETQADVMAGCGSIDYPNGVSTVRVGN